MLSKIKDLVKTHQVDIILIIGVILISLFSFAMGYLVAKNYGKEPIKIESGYHWSGDNGALSCLEAFGGGA